MTDDPFADAIDPDCLGLTLRRWMEQPDGEPLREFLAPAIAHLSCGHVRPMNLRLDVGDDCFCAVCGKGPVVLEVEMLPEPAWFPHPEGLRGLSVLS
jgi:hypothetical protein